MSAISFPPGQAAPQYEVGDFILCHRTGLISACIRIGQRLHYRGPDRQHAFWSHAALVVSPQGDLVEALAKGVQRTHIDRYRAIEYTLVRTHTDPHDQAQILDFVGATVGQRYGWLTIFSLAANSLITSQFCFGMQDESICSGYVARAQERAGAYFGGYGENVMPAGLAKYYGAVRPDLASVTQLA